MALDFQGKKKLLESQIDRAKKRVESQIKRIELIKSDSSKSHWLESAEMSLNDYKRNLRKLEDTYTYLRPDNDLDMENRLKIMKEFPKKIDESIPDETPIVFHGTSNIGTVLQIIKTGGLLTPEQKGENFSSFASGIDVTYKNDVSVSCEFAEPGIVNSYLPYGAIFAFTPLEEEVGNVVRTKGTEVLGGVDGVRFDKEPDRLVSIITTEENKQRIEDWCEEYGWPSGKVTTHEEFIELCKLRYNSKDAQIYSKDVLKSGLRLGVSRDRINEVATIESKQMTIPINEGVSVE